MDANNPGVQIGLGIKTASMIERERREQRELRHQLDDATRSRLHRLIQKLGGGKLTLYAITERRPFTVLLVVSTCAEEALKLIREETGLDWHTSNTTTRAIQRNINAEPSIVTGFQLNHGRPETLPVAAL